VVHKKRRLQGAFSAGIFFLLGVQKFNNGSKVQQWFKGSTMVQCLRLRLGVQWLRRSKVQLVNSASLHFLSSLGIAQASLALHSLLRKLLIAHC